jgi:formylglycine-generating enzyme required for sulfatase activity
MPDSSHFGFCGFGTSEMAVEPVAAMSVPDRCARSLLVMSFARLSRVIVVVSLAAVLGVLAAPAHAVTIDLVPVGNAGNANDPATGNLYGGVAYDYAIGTYDVTIGQYTAFLNAVAATDTYSLYNGSMATDLNVAGIAQTGSSGSYTYSVINNGGNSANRPITYVSWFDSARFANWMANGQPTGAQSSTTTENGAYNVNGATSGTAPAKNVVNPNTSAVPTYFIPNESEWYKAAYYSPLLNSGSGGYYTYATQSDTAPSNVIGSGSNQANYYTGSGYSVTQSGSFLATQNYLTDVGAFSASGSFYGSFDQSGNVYQWNDLTGAAGLSRGLRGGEWNDFALSVSSAGRLTAVTSDEQDFVGFRLASTVIVPEPSAWVMAAGGLACGGYSMWRRRKRA